MKNRYGMDGMTFGAKIDTSTGHFEIFDADNDDFITPPPQQTSYGTVDSFDKSILKQKFFELNA